MRGHLPLDQVREWVKEAGEVALLYRGRGKPQQKEDGTPVTAGDRAVTNLLVERISDRCPDDGIISEEGDSRSGDSDFLWAVDPIDGTRVYAGGLPTWAISVGLLRRGRPYAGVLYLPALQEMYWADQTGSYCNGKALELYPSPQVDDPLTFLAVPSNAHRRYEIDFPRVRSLGSTVLHLLYVARGPAIGALLRRVRIWDLAGVLPFLEQAGRTMAYLSGAPVDLSALLDGRQAAEPILAAHPAMMDELRRRIHPRE